MAAIEAIQRTYYGDKRFLKYLVNGGSKLFGGSFASLNGDGHLIPLAAGAGNFAGIVELDADNTNGADGDKEVRTVGDAIVEMDVEGVTGPGNVDDTVWAADDDQADLGDAGTDISIGKIVQHIAGTRCLVHVQATCMRSL